MAALQMKVTAPAGTGANADVARHKQLTEGGAAV